MYIARDKNSDEAAKSHEDHSHGYRGRTACYVCSSSCLGTDKSSRYVRSSDCVHWNLVATNPGESAPFLVLRLSEAGGKLTGTMSHFKIGGVRHGDIIWSPLTFAESPISDLKLSDSSLWFVWSGAPPFHGGDMKFVAEGNDVAYLNFFVSSDEMGKIFADNPGLGGLTPTIQLHREGKVGGEERQKGSPDEWTVPFTARLINEAEFQYRFDHGVYADYSTLLRSGQLGRTSGLNWTVVPIDLQSETDPLLGYAIQLQLSPDGTSYQLSIVKKISADCKSTVFSDETGAIRRATADCPAE